MSKAKRKKFKLPKLSKQQKIGLGIGAGVLAAVVIANAGRSKVAPGFYELSYLDSEFQPRGIRNNNPGNILYNAANPWEGRISYEMNTDQGRKFEQFKTYVYGVRAMIVLLRNYMKQIRTLSDIVYRWNPGNPNYVNYVANRLGVAADATLKPDKATLKALVQAIADFENGIQSGETLAVTDDMFEAAWSIL